MKKPKEEMIADPRRVSVVLPGDQLALLKRQILDMSREEGRIVTLSEAIRRAVEICYPLPHQYDIFGSKLKGKK